VGRIENTGIWRYGSESPDGSLLPAEIPVCPYHCKCRLTALPEQEHHGCETVKHLSDEDGSSQMPGRQVFGQHDQAVPEVVVDF
jgi:hypothetical protein